MVERGSLLRSCTFTCTGGSNPSSSATENQIVVQVFRGGSFENGEIGGLAERSIAAAWKAVIGYTIRGFESRILR